MFIENNSSIYIWRQANILKGLVKAFYSKKYYRKYSNLVRTQGEIISDPNYLVGIVFKR